MATKLPEDKVRAFQAEIWGFYERSGRHSLPWRKTRNAYKIMVSEIMLQQTQVARVLEKYPEFLKRFPRVETLAEASLSEVLISWQGLGYNRRAQYLWKSAQQIMSAHSGRIPKNYSGLRELYGFGDYTANAVLTFVHNEPRAFIETNIRRVFIHHFFNERGGVSDAEILPLVEATIYKENPREWYYALMDYGAQLPRLAQGNANTQSKHYVRQSAFKGSLRELRGKVIRFLSTGAKSLREIQQLSGDDPRTKEVVVALQKEKFIVYEKRKYKLA